MLAKVSLVEGGLCGGGVPRVPINGFEKHISRFSRGSTNGSVKINLGQKSSKLLVVGILPLKIPPQCLALKSSKSLRNRQITHR